MFLELITAFGFIFVAEMGDKTQVLAMAFATKYNIKKVLLGIFIGSFLNHSLAIVLGAYLSSQIPVATIQVFAGAAFIVFGLWSLKSDDADEEIDSGLSKYGPTITVAIAFFIGELGDKTQLTAIALSAQAVYPVFILIGTVLGMVITGGIGIYVGKKLGAKVPETTIHLIAAFIFLLFGFQKLYANVSIEFRRIEYLITSILVVLVIAFIIFKPTLEKIKSGELTLYRRVSEELHNFYKSLDIQMKKACLGEEHCGTCEGNDCLIGYTKILVRQGLLNKKLEANESISVNAFKQFDRDTIIDTYIETIMIKSKEDVYPHIDRIEAIKDNLEIILFQKTLKHTAGLEELLENIKKIDQEVYQKIIDKLED